MENPVAKGGRGSLPIPLGRAAALSFKGPLLGLSSGQEFFLFRGFRKAIAYHV
jgi:hypothetical protein